MIFIVFLVATLSLFVFFIILPLVLAVLETLKTNKLQNSRLFVGRVWHTRYQPKKHSFTYPIFSFALDLEEELGNFFSPILKFRESDHLKNGEGIYPENKDNSFAQRVLQLVSEKTKGKCHPTLDDHQVFLLTHLSYYGYNFNPVSFYYIISRETNELSAVVAEVSNTPWLEQYSYVLHPDSVDKVQHVKKADGEWFTFPKAFHVSPFMEMDYIYDFIFMGLPTRRPDQPIQMTIINNLRKDNKLAFSAKLQISGQPIMPIQVAWQLIRFPVFCMILQIWIHYQAAWLFIKGVAFVPHPEATETLATRTIATIMVPFFAFRDKFGASSGSEAKAPTKKTK